MVSTVSVLTYKDEGDLYGELKLRLAFLDGQGGQEGQGQGAEEGEYEGEYRYASYRSALYSLFSFSFTILSSFSIFPFSLFILSLLFNEVSTPIYHVIINCHTIILIHHLFPSSLDILSASNLMQTDPFGTANPYVIVEWNGKVVGRSPHQPNTLNPKMNEMYECFLLFFNHFLTIF